MFLCFRAPAKVNLTLHILGRRQDGYHTLDSLVAFAHVGDRLALIPHAQLTLEIRGAGAKALVGSENADNLVLRAAQALAARIPQLQLGRFVLWKRLPIAAGLGGGSSDAAAALRALAALNALSLQDPRVVDAARATGADVPVCLDPRARFMRGIGEIVSSPLGLAPLPAVLVHAGIASPTPAVFAALGLERGTSSGLSPSPPLEGDVISALQQGRNDMQECAAQLTPAIRETLAVLAAAGEARLVRMSGSGATCFALYDDFPAATRAAARIQHQKPGWWTRATWLC